MGFVSIFDILKIGIGPSSSHTMGPWKAALAYRNEAITQIPAHIHVELFGSLAKTGIGHGTPLAVTLGLQGEHVETIQPHSLEPIFQEIRRRGALTIHGQTVAFNPDTDIRFNAQALKPFHPNALTFHSNVGPSETYYSVGGGFILRDPEAMTPQAAPEAGVPYPVESAADLLRWLDKTNLPIHEISRHNERCFRSDQEIDQALDTLWAVMRESIYTGCHTSGILPGGLNIKRRAEEIAEHLLPAHHHEGVDAWQSAIAHSPKTLENVNDWITAFALAVNEVNASFGRIITAPTNGAAGVIPAVLMYHVCFNGGGSRASIRRFLQVAAEVACLFKKRATISAAVGGCQAEIGVSSAMAAAALCDGLKGTPRQALMAAEIAMEHHLGLTCDPIRGLVQVPCIERNCMGAMKALTAARLAIRSDPQRARVSLDDVLQTMMRTANDMSSKYKETSEGGLAAQISVGIPDC